MWWISRKINKIADGLADLTMDRRCSWEQEYDTKLTLKAANLVVQTDGGLREGNCGAAAWIIGLWGDAGKGDVFEPLIAHGTFLETPCSSFGAEAIALDEATLKMQSVIRSDSHHKTRD